MLRLRSLVELVVVAHTREISISKRVSSTCGVGITVADRTDGGAGVIVVGLAPGGAAIRQLQLGDTILSVDGELVSSHIEAISRVDRASDAFKLVVGERAEDFSMVLKMVTDSTSSQPFYSALAPPPSAVSLSGTPRTTPRDTTREPTFTRHEPLHVS